MYLYSGKNICNLSMIAAMQLQRKMRWKCACMLVHRRIQGKGGQVHHTPVIDLCGAPKKLYCSPWKFFLPCPTPKSRNVRPMTGFDNQLIGFPLKLTLLRPDDAPPLEYTPHTLPSIGNPGSAHVAVDLTLEPSWHLWSFLPDDVGSSTMHSNGCIFRCFFRHLMSHRPASLLGVAPPR